MLVLIGFTVVIVCVFGGFVASGGHLIALYQPYELIMIAGAAGGSFIVSNNLTVIISCGRSLLLLLRGFPYTRAFNIELLSMFYELTNTIRKNGVISIEEDVENYKNSKLFNRYPRIVKNALVMEFLCDNLRLIITGRVDAAHLEIVFDTDIETYDSEVELPINAINKVADSMPAFGIVAAVMGVVHTMESMDKPPEILGGLIARALVGTFLGVLIGYAFIAPLSASLDIRRQGTIKTLQAIKVILLAAAHNFAPQIGVEMARKVLYADLRPNSKELEDILREIKSGKSAPAAEAAPTNG